MKRDKETVISEMLINHYEKYYRIAYGYVKNINDAQDIVQESAYKAIFNSEKLREIKYADTWICRIVMNESINFLKKKRSDLTEYYEQERSEEEVGYENIAIREAIEKLPIKEKTLIILRYFEDMTLEQIANVTGDNLSTVKSRLYRAMKKMRIDFS